MTTHLMRGTGANLLIAATGSALVTVVPGVQADVSAAVADSLFGGSAAVKLILGLLVWAFLAVAVAVATSTSTNAFAVVLTGRLEEIALRRLLGSSADNERRRLGSIGVCVALIGCGTGAIVGIALLLVVGPEGLASPWAWVSILIGFGAMFVATMLGARRAAVEVLAAAPLVGLRLTRTDQSQQPSDASRGRPYVFFAGLAIVIGSVPASLVTPFAILLGVVGGVTAMIGSLTAMDLILRAVLSIGSTMFRGHGTVSLAIRLLETRLSASARAATGLFTGTAVVTTFIVALSTLTGALAATYDGDPRGDEAIRTLQSVTASMGLMTSLIVVLSAIGLVTSLLHSLRQRQREIATLRILGQSETASRRTIAAETTVLSFAAVVPGLLLGSLTGWIGAQDVLGAVRELGIVTPVLPLPLLIATVVGVGALLTAVTSLSTRHVLSAPPIRALATT